MRIDYSDLHPLLAPNQMAKLYPCSRLKYLGLVYGSDKRSTPIHTVEHAMSGFRASCAKLAALKYNYSKHALAKLYSALSLPRMLYISSLWDSLSKTEQLKVRLAVLSLSEVFIKI